MYCCVTIEYRPPTRRNRTHRNINRRSNISPMVFVSRIFIFLPLFYFIARVEVHSLNIYIYSMRQKNNKYNICSNAARQRHFSYFKHVSHFGMPRKELKDMKKNTSSAMDLWFLILLNFHVVTFLVSLCSVFSYMWVCVVL